MRARWACAFTEPGEMSERVGDLPLAEVGVVPQDHDLALPLRQPVDRVEHGRVVVVTQDGGLGALAGDAARARRPTRPTEVR